MDLTTKAARLALVSKWATKYGLDPAIVAAVCEQESSWNPYAGRWEPEFFVHYVMPQNLPDLTEAYWRSTSWGLMQVMGQTARELGFQGKFLSQLTDPDIGVDLGCRKLQRCFEVHHEPEVSLLAYNGGANREYGAEVLARVPSYLPDDGEVLHA